MSTFSAITLSVFVLSCVLMLVHAFAPLHKFVDQEYGPRVTRLVMWRMLRAVAIWEAAVGLVLISMGSWETSPALFGMSLLVAGASSAKRRGLM